MNTFFTSDQHFGHKNIIKYAERPFSSIDEMHESIIKKHNEVVKHNDVVFMGGDTALGSTSFLLEILTRLNGKFFVVIGGHDHAMRAITKHRMCKKIIKSGDIIDTKVNGQMMTLCHYPMRSWHASYHGSLLFYGHIHHKETTLYPNSLNIGVDLHNFYPVEWESALEIIKNNNIRLEGRR